MTHLGVFSNSTSGTNESFQSLRELVDEISESNTPTSVQLRALINQQDEEASSSYPATSEEIPSESSTSFQRAQEDNISLSSARSIKSLTAVLFSSRAYKNLSTVGLLLVLTQEPRLSFPWTLVPRKGIDGRCYPILV